MAQPADHKEQVPYILSPEEAYDLLDRKVRRLMHMSGWGAGEFDEIAGTPGNLHIMRLALMMPSATCRS